MTLTEIRTLARRLANTNSTKYSDTNLDASVNAFLDEVSVDIVNAMDGWDVFSEISTTPLVEGQQEYILPEDCVWVKRAEITYDGSSWDKITWVDVNEIGRATDSTSIANNFSKDEPKADLHDNSLFMYPIPDQDVSEGLKLWYVKLPTQLEDTDDAPGFIRSFHKLLAYGAAKDYLEQYVTEEGNVNRLSQTDRNIIALTSKMKKIYNMHNKDRDYVVAPAYVDYGYDE